ncbi:MAG: hypothetical protein LLG00_11150 [Planctomycetaceae bacterium]|nr:hypothetical protein [Planctomycetaceae bacterium]
MSLDQTLQLGEDLPIRNAQFMVQQHCLDVVFQFFPGKMTNIEMKAGEEVQELRRGKRGRILQGLSVARFILAITALLELVIEVAIGIDYLSQVRIEVAIGPKMNCDRHTWIGAYYAFPTCGKSANENVGLLVEEVVATICCMRIDGVLDLIRIYSLRLVNNDIVQVSRLLIFDEKLEGRTLDVKLKGEA